MLKIVYTILRMATLRRLPVPAPMEINDVQAAMQN